MTKAELMGVDAGWARERRIEYLTERCAEYKTRIDMVKMEWTRDLKTGTSLMERMTKWYLADIPALEKKLKRYFRELSIRLKGLDVNGISEDEIQLARDMDIADLVDGDKRGFIKCINPEHDDKTPSMYIKNGFAYCFSCGAKYDVIGFAMAKHNLSFPEAVRLINEVEVTTNAVKKLPSYMTGEGK